MMVTKGLLKRTAKRLLLLFPPIVLVSLFILYLICNSRQENAKLTDEIRAKAPGKFIRLEEGLVHYKLQGSGSSGLIVFIHGGGITGSEVWARNLPYFIDAGYRVLTYDLYGRGYSDRPYVDNSPALFHSQLTQLLDKLRISGPFDLVALSMGAIIALEYAHANPDRVKKMILIDPAASGNYQVNPLLNIPLISDFLMTVYWYPRAVDNQRKEFASDELFEDYSSRLRYFMNFDGYKHTNYSTWMHMLNQNRLDLIGSGPMNVLLIYGKKDPYFNEGQLRHYRSRLPSIRVSAIGEAGHMPQYEKPDTINKLIGSFLHEP